MYLILHKQLETPVLYLSDYIIQNKNDYYRLLQEVRTKENWEEWILFILRGVEYTAKVTIEQIAQINQLFDKIQEKVKKSIPKVYSKDLIELLFEHPYCKIEYVMDRLDLSRVTASKYLHELEGIGVLQSKKVWKETLYVNKELFGLLKK